MCRFLKIKNARLALSTVFDKKGLATSFLNDGSVAANYYVPKGFLKGPDKKILEVQQVSLIKRM